MRDGERLRVCLLCYAGYPDQGATYFFEMARSLAAIGHDVHVLAVQRAGEPIHATEDGVHVERVPLHLTVSWGSARRWLDKARFLLHAAARSRAEHFDIVHVYTTTGVFLVPLFGSKRSKWVHEIQSGAVSAGWRFVRSLLDRVRALESSVFDVTFVVSSVLGARLFGANAPKVEVVPAGVNLGDFRPGLARDFRLERGIPPDAIVFVHAGVVEVSRATDVIVRAFAKARAADDRLWLLMPGKGAQLDELRSLARALGVEDRVWLPGYVAYPSLPRIFAAADAGLSYLPRVEFYEGQPPMKVMEYLGAGLPVIATDVSGHRALIREGENGLLTEPSEAEYAGALMRFAGDQALQRRLSMAARPSVEEMTYDRIARERVIPAYRRILSGSYAGVVTEPVH